MITPLLILSLRNNGEAKATHSGAVVTMTTELATEVYSKELIQVAKWRANNTPDNEIKIQCLFVNVFISSRDLINAKGNMTRAAKSIRKDAITIEGVPSRCAKRIKMDAVETAKIAPVIAKYGDKDFLVSMDVYIICNYSYISLIDIHFLERYNFNNRLCTINGGSNGI